MVIIAIAVVLVLFVLVAPAILVIRKGMQTQYGKQQLRNFGITVLVTSSLTVLSVAAISSLGGNYSSDWIRLFQFLITVMAWALTIHLVIKRGFGHSALESTRYFGREYFAEMKALIGKGEKSLQSRFS